MMMKIDYSYLAYHIKNFIHHKPFTHCVIDNFFPLSIAKKLESEYPSFEDEVWHKYRNPLEIKNTCNNWNAFPPTTYQIFRELSSSKVCKFFSDNLPTTPLYPDEGLNGGGWHVSGPGGKLNPHLDYFIHPKLNLQRKFNLIIYLNSDWVEEWGGHFGLWNKSHNDEDRAGLLRKSILPLFNRAIIFETSNSWHGLANKVKSPKGQLRKSMAVYYLTQPSSTNALTRYKALYSPTEDQEGDSHILDIIKQRASLDTANKVWRTK